MALLDKVDWHSGGDFPSHLPPERGGTHIGMFIGWLILHDMVVIDDGDDLATRGIRDVKARKLTGRGFLEQYWDEAFADDHLSEDGKRFSSHYYGLPARPKAQYIEDYELILSSTAAASLYEVTDTWGKYDALSPFIDTAFRDWKYNRTDPRPSTWQHLRSWLSKKIE